MTELNPFEAEAIVTTDGEAVDRAKRLSSGAALLFGGIAGAVTGLVLNLTSETKGWRKPAILAAVAAGAGLVIANLTWYLKPKRDRTPRTPSPESDVLVIRPGADPERAAEHDPATAHTARLDAAREQARTQPLTTIH